jgi:alpha-1,3-glucosyltransferase
MPDGALVKLSTVLTAAAFLPGAVALLHTGWSLRPSDSSETTSDKEKAPTPLLTLLPYALLTSAFGFFLFSFQVHEKTILLPLLPMTLLLSSAQVDSSAFGWGMLTNNTAVFRCLSTGNMMFHHD